MRKPFSILLIPFILTLLISGCAAYDKIIAIIPYEKQPLDEESLAEIAAYIPESTLDDILHDFYTYQTVEGLQKTNQILEQEPDNPMALALLAVFALQENNLKNANDYARQALKKNTNLSLAHSIRAWVLYKSENRLLAAERECKIALSLEPDSSIAYTICSQIYVASEDNEDGLRYLKKAVELEPNNIFAIYYLCYMLVYQNSAEEAIAPIEHAVELNPDLEFLIYERGYVYFFSGKYDLALKDFNDLIEKGWKDQYLYDYRGYIYSQTGNLEAALKDYRRALLLDPDNARLNNNVAYYMTFLDQDLNEALTYAEKAVSLEPESDYAIDTKAYLFYKLGRYDEALELFNGLIDRDATYAHFGRAFVYFDLGQYDLAKEDITLYMQLYPEDNLYIYAEKLLEDINHLP